MNTELQSLYTEVSKQAIWLKGNFQTGDEHKKLVDFLAANQLRPYIDNVPVIMDRCMKSLRHSEEALEVYLNELSQVFRYYCMKDKDQCHPAIKNVDGGLTVPSTITLFYWDESDPSKVLQLQDIISLQTGDIVDFRMFPDFIPVNSYYVKDKVTQFSEQGMIIGYRLAVWDIVPIEE